MSAARCLSVLHTTAIRGERGLVGGLGCTFAMTGPLLFPCSSFSRTKPRGQGDKGGGGGVCTASSYPLHLLPNSTTAAVRFPSQTACKSTRVCSYRSILTVTRVKDDLAFSRPRTPAGCLTPLLSGVRVSKERVPREKKKKRNKPGWWLSV